MKKAYKDIKFRPAVLDIIQHADNILSEYTRAGLVVTVRQLYYQFVARTLIENTPQSYKRLAGIISDARLAGLVDWDAIEDRGRVPDVPRQWGSAREILDVAMRQFRLPRWEDQEAYIELWVEKQALAGVLEPLARRHHITLMVNKGYSSQSAMRESAIRFSRAEDCGKSVVLGYLGDHDPSGEDMVRDIRDRLALFGVEALQVDKLALNMDQVRQYKLPPNPAKSSDSRFKKHQEEFGDESWEVDALNPKTLQEIVTDWVLDYVDREKLDAVIAREDSQRRAVQKGINIAMREVSDE